MDRIQRTLRLSVFEGAFYALMVGFGEAYFLADAVRLGASPVEAGLVVSLPLFAGSAGPLIVLALLRKLTRRKLLVAGPMLGQIAVLLGLGLATGEGLMTPGWIIAAACIYQICGQAAGTAWASWFGDLVPKRVRGSYFAGRNRWVHISTCAALIAGGSLLQHLEPESAATAGGLGGEGFRLIFFIAAGARLVSAVLILLSAEPRFHGLSDAGRVLRYLKTERGGGAWRLLGVGCALHFVVYLASPYFAPFMLGTLRFSYLEYTAASVCIVVVKVAVLPLWGRMIDQHGPRQVYGLAVLGVALIPLPFALSSGLGLVLVAQAISGLSWGSHELSQFALILDSTYKRTRAQLFAAQSVLNGGAMLAGCLCAAPMLALAGGDMRALFLISMAGRLALGLALPKLLPVEPGPTVPRRRDLLLRVIGIRAHGGLVHRPLAEEGEDERDQSN